MIYHEKTGHPVFFKCRFSDEDKFSGGMEVTEYLSYKYLRFTDFVLTLFIKYGKNKIYS